MRQTTRYCPIPKDYACKRAEVPACQANPPSWACHMLCYIEFPWLRTRQLACHHPRRNSRKRQWSLVGETFGGLSKTDRSQLITWCRVWSNHIFRPRRQSCQLKLLQSYPHWESRSCHEVWHMPSLLKEPKTLKGRRSDHIVEFLLLCCTEFLSQQLQITIDRFWKTGKQQTHISSHHAQLGSSAIPDSCPSSRTCLAATGRSRCPAWHRQEHLGRAWGKGHHSWIFHVASSIPQRERLERILAGWEHRCRATCRLRRILGRSKQSLSPNTAVQSYWFARKFRCRGLLSTTRPLLCQFPRHKHRVHLSNRNSLQTRQHCCSLRSPPVVPGPRLRSTHALPADPA